MRCSVGFLPNSDGGCRQVMCHGWQRALPIHHPVEAALLRGMIRRASAHEFHRETPREIADAIEAQCIFERIQE
jgi:hypothetical protein